MRFTFLCVSVLLYIVGAQYLIAKLLRWFPISGFDPDPSVVIRFLALPILVGVVSGFGGEVRFYRTIFVEEGGRDYVRTARAKGLKESVVVMVHVLRNSMIPVVTIIALGMPAIFGGAIITENVFKVNGIGQLLLTALRANDLPMVMTLTFIFAVLIVLFNLIADILYGLLDPRIRYD